MGLNHASVPSQLACCWLAARNASENMLCVEVMAKLCPSGSDYIIDGQLADSREE